MGASVVKSINPPKTINTRKFYNELMDGKISRGLWGKYARFNAMLIPQKYSVKKYYLDVIKDVITKNDKVIDYGCGSGGFLIATAPLCKEIVGIDISERFVAEGQNNIREMKIENASISHAKGDQIAYSDAYFDVLIMIDVIHHLESIDSTLMEAFRVLKPGGKIIVFEPNKLNPLLALMCVIDRNEWGLLKLGTKKKYRELLTPRMKIDLMQFNGLLIGPEIKFFLLVADIINKGIFYKFFGWLNPKILVIGKKNDNNG